MTKELEAAAAELQEERKCLWTPIRNAYGYYENSCLEFQHKRKNDYLYCPNCGGKIEVVG
jgi:hypothetical protein